MISKNKNKNAFFVALVAILANIATIQGVKLSPRTLRMGKSSSKSKSTSTLVVATAPSCDVEPEPTSKSSKNGKSSKSKSSKRGQRGRNGKKSKSKSSTDEEEDTCDLPQEISCGDTIMTAVTLIYPLQCPNPFALTLMDLRLLLIVRGMAFLVTPMALTMALSSRMEPQ